MEKRRLVIGVSGASGMAVAEELLTFLHGHPLIETHLVITRGGELTLGHETAQGADALRALAHVTHDISNIGASIASGTFKTAGMVVVPCSMKTLAGIAGGYSDNLLLRAADVTLKERRRLVLVTRESPLSTIHLRNMLTLSQMGAVILPPVITGYHRPQTVQDMVDHIAGKVLDQFDIEYGKLKRWEG